MLWDLFQRKGIESAEPNANITLGRKGEDLAVRFLCTEGYKVLYRNYRAPKGGEVDIVCREKTSRTLVFVEVKTRSSLDFGAPSDAVNREKQRLITRGAFAWLRMLDNPDIVFRFDIVEVVMQESGPALSVIRDAFSLPEPYIY